MLPFSSPGDLPKPGIEPIAGRFFNMRASREAQECWRGWPVPSPGDLPDPGIKPGSLALQADSLPTELPGKPMMEREEH